jgi:hypothetical protein
MSSFSRPCAPTNIPLSVALGGRNCGIWNVLQGKRAAESALDERKSTSGLSSLLAKDRWTFDDEE